MAEYNNRKVTDPITQATDLQVPTEHQNRGNDTKSDQNTTPITVTLLTIDETLIKYLSERIEPIVTQDGKSVKVPIIYGNPERWKSIQKDGVLRDKFNKIQLPIIMLRRTTLKKNMRQNSPVNKYLERQFETGWNRYNPYDRFAAVNGIKPVKKYVTTVTPDYFDLTYECMIWTEYVEQMNKLVEQVSFEDDEYWGNRGQYKFRTSVNEYKTDTVLPNVQDRLVRTSFNLNVSAYLLPEKMVGKTGQTIQTAQQRYSVKKIVTFTEIEEG
jgi:hypothetical protein